MGTRGKPKGLPKSGGRVAGTPNKSKQTLLEICERKKIVPFEALLDLYAESDNDMVRLGAIREAAKYIYPQLKSIEHSGEINNPYLNKTPQELEALVKAKLKQ